MSGVKYKNKNAKAPKKTKNVLMLMEKYSILDAFKKKQPVIDCKKL